MRTVKIAWKGTAMTQKADRKSWQARIGEAQTVLRELTEALEGAGITLPSLGLDTVSYVDPHPQPLIQFGRCNLDTARKLTAALKVVR
jgi:hypothetical protein